MRKLALITIIGAIGISFGTAFAEEPLPPSVYDDHPSIENNTGSMATGSDAVANIQAETGSASPGVIDGEITLYYESSSGIRVYSGANKVEVIPTDADGWAGSYEVETGNMKFTPTGRPQLDCPATSGGWYGPCKLPEVEGT